MGAADNSDQLKASFKLSVMQRASIIVPEISDDFFQFHELSFQMATNLGRHCVATGSSIELYCAN